MGVWLIIRRHNRVVDDAALLVTEIAAIKAARGTAFRRGHIVEVVIHRQYRQCGLGLRLSNDLAPLIFEMREVPSSLLLSKLFGPLLPLLVPALDDLRNTLQGRILDVVSAASITVTPYLVNLVAAVLLKITADVAQERDIKKGGRNQKQEGTSEDEDSEKCRECEGGGDDGISPEVFGEVVPITLVALLRLVDSIQGQSVDGLTRAVGQKNTLPTLESEENEEGDAVTAFRGFPNVVKEAEVIV